MLALPLGLSEWTYHSIRNGSCDRASYLESCLRTTAICHKRGEPRLGFGWNQLPHRRRTPPRLASVLLSALLSRGEDVRPHRKFPATTWPSAKVRHPGRSFPHEHCDLCPVAEEFSPGVEGDRRRDHYYFAERQRDA